jgi:Fe-S-cluster containining protein
MSDAELVHDWLRAGREPAVLAELEGIYAYVAAAVESRRPVCVSSGRCCRFEEWGHRLYVTGLETAYTVQRLGAGMPALDGGSLAAARAAGGCPFQVEKLCGVHSIRPLGCRIYYCDATAQEWQQEIYERTLRELRGLHERHGIEYRYGEWRAMLGMFVGG